MTPSTPGVWTHGARTGHLTVPLSHLRAHTPTGGGHGGTRNINTSRKVHPRFISPAAMAGVRGRHCLAEPVPLVGRGCDNGTRRLAWGKQKSLLLGSRVF